MLLNGESLQKLARDSSYPPRLEGSLHVRKNGSNDKLQKRYLVLKGNLLFYYGRKSDKIPLGLIVLEGYTVELSNEFEGYCFQLLKRNNNESKNNHASYTFMADDAESLEIWMTALTTCSYEHLKITVESLKEQAANMLPDEFNDQNSAPASITVENKRKSKTFAELHEQYAKQIEELPKRLSKESIENDTH